MERHLKHYPLCLPSVFRFFSCAAPALAGEADIVLPDLTNVNFNVRLAPR